MGCLVMNEYSRDILSRWTLYLLYTCHLPFLLFLVLLPFLSRFVNSSYESFDITLMPKTVFVMLPGRYIVCDIDFAVFAEVSLLGDPILAHR